MKFNTKLLGGSLVAAGPLVINFGTYPFSWWIGFVFTTIGPFLMAIEFHQSPAKTKIKSKRKPL